jgi:hypothetical protein
MRFAIFIAFIGATDTQTNAFHLEAHVYCFLSKTFWAASCNAAKYINNLFGQTSENFLFIKQPQLPAYLYDENENYRNNRQY